MYITNNNSGPISPTTEVASNCPVTCQPSFHLYVNILGLVFGVACLIAYFAQKMVSSRAKRNKTAFLSQIIFVIFALFLLLFVLYFLTLEHQAQPAGCTVSDWLLSVRWQPDFLHPLYLAR
ncbi:MAG: hypothetical protein WC453_01670 [Patescibacteria group bacterium]